MKLDDDIHNYYEHLVLERIGELGLQAKKDANYIADLCCLALNQVPSRYIRYEVDMAFFMEGNERNKMQKEVASAIEQSMAMLEENKHKRIS